jgi:argininosuccinate synthase
MLRRVTLIYLLEDFETAKEKALKIGALKCLVVDRKKEMVDICMTAVRANLIYENVYLLGKSAARSLWASSTDGCAGTSLARPVIARA